MKLHTEPRLPRVDDIYERLISLHAGRSDEESHVVNARLILLLANQVGDYDLVVEAIAEAARVPTAEDCR